MKRTPANNTANAIKTWAHGSSAFEETYSGSNSDYNQMTVAPTKEGLKEIDPTLSQCWLVVSYSATVKLRCNAGPWGAGNTNDVTLTWKRTSMDYMDTLEDRCRVYTFGLNIKKEFTDSNKGRPHKGSVRLKE